MATQDETEDPQPVGAPGRTPIWLIALRVLALLLLPLVAIGALVTFVGVLGAGRHANVGGALIAVLGFTAVAIVLPMAVFVPRHRPSHQTWHAVGALAIFVAAAAAGPTVWRELVVPASQHRQFDRVIATVQLGPVRTEPLVIEGVPIGLRTTVVVRLGEPVPLDAIGHVVLRMMETVRLRTNVGIADLPFDQMAPRATVRFGGQLLDLEGLRKEAVNVTAGKSGPSQTLQAGEYTAEFDAWHWGLDLRNRASMPCRMDPQAVADILPQLAKTSDIRVHVQAVASYETRTVTGKREVKLSSPPFAYPYDHAAWQRQLEALPIETCAVRAERERRKQAEAAERRKVDDYLAGRIPWADNPLRKAVCAHDVAAMREVLRIGEPKFPVSGLIASCGIDTHHPEIFDTLFPMAHADATDREGYCNLIHALLERRDEAALKRLHALGLPVFCPEYRHIMAVLFGAREPAQKLAWMRTLAGLGMDPCQATPGGVTMLQMAARLAAPEQIEFLLDAGCDPSRLPVLGHVQSGPPHASAPLAWLLRVRGYLYIRGEPQPPPLPAEVVERISRRLGEVTDEELLRVHPKSGVSGPLLVAAQRGEGWSAAGNVELVAWLGARGVRMDAANEFGFSWYTPGYSHMTGKPPKGHEILDGLSVAQLRQMLKPVNLASGKPGKPLDAAKDMSEGGLGAYLCRRGAIRC